MSCKSFLLTVCEFCLVSVTAAALLSHAAIADDGYAENPGTEGNGNFTIGPDYQIDPDLTDRGNPKGEVL